MRDTMGFSKPLRTKHFRFAQAYVTCDNGKQAAIEAGYPEKSAGWVAHDLLRSPRIVAEINRLRRDAIERTDITLDRILREVAAVAFFDPRRLYDSSGRKLSPRELDDATARALELSANGQFKAASKIKALELLGQHFSAWDRATPPATSSLAQLVFVLPSNGRDPIPEGTPTRTVDSVAVASVAQNGAGPVEAAMPEA